jgi:NIMA (never in mitosis gene a)-related kinase
MRLSDKQIYALKKVSMAPLSTKERENALNEVRILASIKHPNVVAYKEAFIEEAEQSLCIVMEYADDGDVYQKIVQLQKSKAHFEEDDVWKIFIGMCRGLQALHRLRILHRDMKSANIFLSKEGQGFVAKLGDLNVSKVAKGAAGLLYTQTGTPYYASPEVWKD